VTKDEILAALPNMTSEDLSAIKHAANKLMYERNKEGMEQLIANPPEALNNLDNIHLPRELKDAMEMNKEAILTAYGVMKSLGLITETENGTSDKET